MEEIKKSPKKTRAKLSPKRREKAKKMRIKEVHEKYIESLEKSALESQCILATSRKISKQNLLQSKAKAFELSKSNLSLDMSLSNEVSFSVSSAVFHHSNEDLSIPTLSENPLTADNIRVESNLPESAVDDMAFYEQEKFSNRATISQSPPAFDLNSRSSPSKYEIHSQTSPLNHSRSPVISDVIEKSLHFVIEVTDNEIELFNNSKSVIEREPITMKIRTQLRSYADENRHDLMDSLIEKIKPGLMTKEDFQSSEESTEPTYQDGKAQNVADEYFPEENFFVLHVSADGNCFPRACSKALTFSEAYWSEIKLSSGCYLYTNPDKVSKIVTEKEQEAFNEVGATVDLNKTEHDIMNEVRITLTDGGYSGPYQIATAALICNVRINMAFPPVNGDR